MTSSLEFRWKTPFNCRFSISRFHVCFNLFMHVFLWVIPSQIIQKNEFVTHHLRIPRLVYQWFALIWVDKTQNFSPIQFAHLDLWPIKDKACRAVPGKQKLHFCHFCQISQKTSSLLNFRVLHQNLMIKSNEFELIMPFLMF